MKRLTLLAQTAAVLFLASAARAQSPADPVAASPSSGARFAQSGRVSLAAERLFGITYASQSPGSSSVTTVSLFGCSGMEAGDAPYSIPRLGLDYFASNGFSIGLGAEFANASPSGGGSSVTVVGINPRLGYAARLSDIVSLWPRGGISYFHIDTGQSSYLLALSLEAQLVVTPLPHFGFMFGPSFDIGISGTQGRKITQVGLMTALLGWF